MFGTTFSFLLYIDSPVFKAVDVFIQRIYHRGKLLCINIDMLLFFLARSCMWPLRLGESQSKTEQFCQPEDLQGDASALLKDTEAHLLKFNISLGYF